LTPLPSSTRAPLPLASIDARAKLLHLVLTGALLFLSKSPWAGALYLLLLALLLCLGGRTLFALKTLGVYALVMGGSQALLALPSALALPLLLHISTMLSMRLVMVARFIPLTALIMTLLETTGIGQVIQALEYGRVPRVVTVPVSVMFRFAPTISQEMGHIADAMRMRGIRPTPAGLVKAPAALLEHLFLPFLVRATKVSEELAASAVVRGIENPAPRTVRLPLRWRTRDSVYVAIVLASFFAVLVADTVVF
jgi:energy-coupling factor transport system permease protein